MHNIKDENVHRFVKIIHRVPIIHSNGYMYTGRERDKRHYCNKTWTKAFIRYAKEKDREERERRSEWERKVEGERERYKRERERDREREKGRGIEIEWKEEDREEEKISTSISRKISRTSIW